MWQKLKKMSQSPKKGERVIVFVLYWIGVMLAVIGMVTIIRVLAS